jgi:hypothetical protein
MNLLLKILSSSILSLGIASPVFAELQSFECYDQKKARLATVWEQWQPMLTYNVETGSVYRYDFNNNTFNKITEKKFKSNGVDKINSYSTKTSGNQLIYTLNQTTQDYGLTFDITNYIYTIDLNSLDATFDIKSRVDEIQHQLKCVKVPLPQTYKINS